MPRYSSIFLVPDSRQILRASPPFDEILLDFEPQHNVKVVGEFIGFDSNQRGLHAIDGRVELLPVEGAQLMMKRLLEHGIKETPERSRPAHAVFPHARLAFMNAERDRIAQRCAEVAGVEPLIV